MPNLVNSTKLLCLIGIVPSTLRPAGRRKSWLRLPRQCEQTVPNLESRVRGGNNDNDLHVRGTVRTLLDTCGLPQFGARPGEAMR